MEAVQTNLKGIWRKPVDGCPHLYKGDIDKCELNEMRPCLYEVGDGPCKVFQDIIEEWCKEKEAKDDKTDAMQNGTRATR